MDSRQLVRLRSERDISNDRVKPEETIEKGKKVPSRINRAGQQRKTELKNWEGTVW